MPSRVAARTGCEPVSPAALVRLVTAPFAAKAAAKGLSFDLDLAPGLPDALLIETGVLCGILTDLLDAAVRTTTAGGASVSVWWRAPGQLRIDITDTGAGLAPPALARLVKRLAPIEALGGKVGVKSALRKGTAVWLDLPAPPVRPAEQRPLPQPRVLVVDDNVHNRDMVRNILAALEVDLAEADGGEAAVASAGLEAYDLILMDIRMPGVDGRQALARIRAGAGPNRTTPVLAFTADHGVGALAALKGEGFEACLAKPINPTELVEQISRWSRPAWPASSAPRLSGFAPPAA